MNTPKTLTLLEQHQLLDALLVKKGTEKQFRKAVRNYTMALLMLDAGLRVGEVIQLYHDDLMVADNPIENLVVREEITKTKTERTIPLSQRLRDSIVTMQEKWWYSDGVSCNAYAFYTGNEYGHLTTRQVERIIRAASMKSIGRPVHPHVLRHTFASKLMRRCNVRIVQELLGHQSLSSTQIYTHPNEDDKKKAISDIEDKETSADLQRQVRSELSDLPNHLDTGNADRDV